MTIAKAKRPRKPVYFTVEKLVRASTGEEVGALVPRHACDVIIMRERKYTTGTRLRAELKKPRDERIHRKAHALGELVRDQLEGFESLDAHGAVKRLQAESGAFCDVRVIDASPISSGLLSVARAILGDQAADELAANMPRVKAIKVYEPRSIAFDEMDEGEFEQLINSIYRHIAATYWPGMTPERIDAMVEMYEGGRA